MGRAPCMRRTWAWGGHHARVGMRTRKAPWRAWAPWPDRASGSRVAAPCVAWMLRPRACTVAQLQAIQAHDTEADLPRIRVPALVVHGDEDEVVPVENGRRLAARLPNARLLILPRTGHLCVPRRPPSGERQAAGRRLTRGASIAAVVDGQLQVLGHGAGGHRAGTDGLLGRGRRRQRAVMSGAAHARSPAASLPCLSNTCTGALQHALRVTNAPAARADRSTDAGAPPRGRRPYHLIVSPVPLPLPPVASSHGPRMARAWPAHGLAWPRMASYGLVWHRLGLGLGLNMARVRAVSP